MNSKNSLTKLYIEPSSRCNLSCKMCFRNTWINESFADMDSVVFDRIMETLPDSVATVFFGGMGEPLCHPDIIRMVKAASDKNRRVELLTNATLLNQAMAHSLLNAGLNMLWVSVDSFHPAGYETIRENSLFGLIETNLKIFNSERAKLDKPVKLGIAFVAMKSNVQDLAMIPEFMAKYRVDEVNISNVIPSDQETEKQMLYSRLISQDVGTKQYQQYYPMINIPFMDWRQKDAMHGLEKLLFSSFGNVSIAGQPLFRQNQYCRFIEEGHAFVRHDGQVSPCMALLHSAAVYLNGSRRNIYHHSFGQVLDSGIDAIWRSSEYTNFRERVKSFDFSPCLQCGGCPDRDENETDCFGNKKPTCGACLWAEGFVSCP